MKLFTPSELSTYKNTAKAPTIPPATPTTAPAVCIAPAPVLLTAVADADADAAATLLGKLIAPAPPTVLFGPPFCTTALPPLALLAAPDVVLVLVNTGMLVALGPQTQWLMVPSATLANMLMHAGAEDALQAMAAGSL